LILTSVDGSALELLLLRLKLTSVDGSALQLLLLFLLLCVLILVQDEPLHSTTVTHIVDFPF
jgi:hypothetical protein